MKNTNTIIFDTAYRLWQARGAIRSRRERLKRYTYGDQWSDIVPDRDGRMRPESEIILETGRRPMTNNLIRRLVKTIVGRYRDTCLSEKLYDTSAASVDSVRELDELDSRLFEEFLISGMAIQRVADDDPLLADGLPQVVNVNPASFFVNDFRDPRGCDIEMLGMLHDMSPAEALLRFARGKKKEIGEALLRELSADMFVLGEGSAHTGNGGFFAPREGCLRVVETWTREIMPDGRLAWRARWYSARGKLLDSYASPWQHGGHPFAVKFYPLTDGEVHSFVEDLVDQQRYINRLVVLIDRILSTSAKGVLLFPTEQKPENFSWEDVARRWASTDGVIPLTGHVDMMPQQLHTQGGGENAYRLLDLELKLFEEASGVSATLSGNTVSGTRASTGEGMYRAQVENATIALNDIFRTFRSLIAMRTAKLKNLSCHDRTDYQY